MNALDLLYIPLALITAPFWARKSRADWPERLGRTEGLPASTRPRILLHAVSVGEVNALRELVPHLAPHAEVIVSVTTDTGIARARDLFRGTGLARVVRYPLDFSGAVRRFLDAVRPDAVGLVELEIWPNFVKACHRRLIPVAVINGRLSARSFKGYRRARWFFRPSFRRLAVAAVQDSDYAARFRRMGAPDVRVTGSMKWDSARIEDHVPAAGALAVELGIDRSRPLIVAGSTAEDEEALLHQAVTHLERELGPVQLLCAPRKPEHFDAAAATLPGCVRRSERRTAPAGTTRFLLDTIGELRAAYALADVVVVGRSFGTLFGSDPIEPVALGKPTLIGPSRADFQQPVAALAGAGGLVLTTRDTLAADLAALLKDPTRRADIARRGRDAIGRQQGASRIHASLLLELADRSRTRR